MLPVSQKTAYRDIWLLKQAGVLQIRYSKSREAFAPTGLVFTQPDWPENQTQKRYLEKNQTPLHADGSNRRGGGPYRVVSDTIPQPV